MAEANSVLSTPRLNSSLNNIAEPTATYCVDTSRRRFLSQAAALTAGGAALATALSASETAAGTAQAPDPILEAIERHKAAHAEWVSCVDRHGKLENELPAERRCSDTSRDNIVETDDPRWIEAELQLDLTGDAAIEAAYALIEVIPTTRLGVLALLEHAVGHDADGQAWPDEWREGLLANLSNVLPTLWQEGAAA
jgi:hypothetical protein